MIHTPDKWKVVGGTEIHGKDGFLFDCCSDDSDLSLEEAIAVAARIVACVNACAGIPTSVLEAQTSGHLTASQIIAMRENYFIELERDELKQQRDELDRRCTEYALQCNRYSSLNAELLGALMNLSAVARHYLPDYDEHQEIKNAETAIAKARGNSHVHSN